MLKVDYADGTVFLEFDRFVVSSALVEGANFATEGFGRALNDDGDLAVEIHVLVVISLDRGNIDAVAHEHKRCRY